MKLQAIPNNVKLGHKEQVAKLETYLRIAHYFALRSACQAQPALVRRLLLLHQDLL